MVNVLVIVVIVEYTQYTVVGRRAGGKIPHVVELRGPGMLLGEYTVSRSHLR